MNTIFEPIDQVDITRDNSLELPYNLLNNPGLTESQVKRIENKLQNNEEEEKHNLLKADCTSPEKIEAAINLILSDVKVHLKQDDDTIDEIAKRNLISYLAFFDKHHTNEVFQNKLLMLESFLTQSLSNNNTQNEVLQGDMPSNILVKFTFELLRLLESSEQLEEDMVVESSIDEGMKESDIKCEECGKVFKKRNKLNRHIKETHTDIKPYTCTECGADFKRNSHLTRHKNLKHSDENKSFVCSIDNCFQKFSIKQHLDRHIKTIHFGERLGCEECGIFFNKKTLFAKHISTVHSAPKPFLCPVEDCGKGFFRETDLRKHEKIVHESPNDQSTCSTTSKKRRKNIEGKSTTTEALEKASEFPDVSSAKLTRSKSGKQVYVCFYDDCLKALTSKYNLRNHIKTHHLGISDFSCDQCDLKYKHKKSLQEHIAKCHVKV